MDASHFDGQSAYASVSRLRIDDLRPYVYRTHDGGKSWQPIVEGLPNAPVNAVREDPVRKGLLYAATETGMWVSFDDGDHWQSLQLNLPASSMRDVVVHGSDLIVATHGRAFWILDDITPLRQMSADTAQAAAFLFKPAQAVRVRRSLNTDTPLPADEPMGENPPDGAILDYSLGAAASAGPVTLEIVDASGKLVRRYTSSDTPWITPEELARQTIPPGWVKLPETLSASTGLHRWVWDLHYAAPTVPEHEYPISAVPHRTPQYPLGPRALPGSYTVRLTANGTTLTQPLTVTMDPRVTTTPAGLAQVFDLEMRLSDMLTRSSDAITKAKAALGQPKISAKRKARIEEVLNGPKPPAARVPAHRPAKRAEATAERKQPPPARPVTLTEVQGAVGALYGMLDRADAAPTSAQVEAVNATIAKFNEIMTKWEALRVQ